MARFSPMVFFLLFVVVGAFVAGALNGGHGVSRSYPASLAEADVISEGAGP